MSKVYGLLHHGEATHGLSVKKMVKGFIKGQYPIDEHGNPLMWRTKYESAMTVCEHGSSSNPFVAISKTHLDDEQRVKITKTLLKLTSA